MSEQPLTLVPAELAEALCREAVQRYVPRFEKERRVGIAVTAHQWAEGPPVAVCRIPPGRRNAPVHEAVARLLCRRNLGGDLLNSPKIEVRGWSVLYNQPELATRVV